MMTLEEAQKHYKELVSIEREKHEKMMRAHARLFDHGWMINENADEYQEACEEWKAAMKAADDFCREYHDIDWQVG